MKPTKVAAVVAGSMMALGAAAPAMAAEATPGLNGALGALSSSQPLKSDALSSTTEGSPLKAVTDTAEKVNQVGQAAPLLGGLPLPK
ncbi:hypothetical protein ACGFMM_33930 [Streptomyces sp. NPDC048604]|uniref:hypothetical protein n=1 Tax=Streptomyces sp. NPDC048604 TaxID=3365578 RepID=UPI0037155656